MRGLVALALLASAETAQASTPSIRVDTLRSDRRCGVAFASWSWLVIECEKQFPKLRAALQSMLAESGVFSLATNGAPADFAVSAEVTGLGVDATKATARDYCSSASHIKGRIDYRVRRSDRTMAFAGSVTKSSELSHHVVAGGGNCSADAVGPGDYKQLETAMALALARAISFKYKPLEVVDASENRIVLNYGAPFLALGDGIDLFDRFGGRMRYRVTGSNGPNAFAVADGHRFAPVPGTKAIYVERDSPGDNARRWDKVDLP
jgi:hypothetical protein